MYTIVHILHFQPVSQDQHHPVIQSILGILLWFLIDKMNICLRHSIGHFRSNTFIILASSGIKLAMSFHLWLASLIIRTFFFSPLSMYLNNCNSPTVGTLSAIAGHIKMIACALSIQQPMANLRNLIVAISGVH